MIFDEPGILLIDKPQGLTSQRVVSILKKRFGFKRIGHAGTLDPMATGLLVCLVNAATRIAQYAERGRKTYRGTFELGLVTDTDDIEGSVISRSDKLIDFDELAKLTASFKGPIEQVPPAVSAVKIKGQPSYRYVRRGESVSLSPRTVEVYDFSITPISATSVGFRIECSPGTYIRSIARDLGTLLGCGACLSSLCREASEPFVLQQARPLDQVSINDLRAWSDLFPSQERYRFAGKNVEMLRFGDQRCLDQLKAVPEQPETALYLNEDTGREAGILLSRAGRWELGVHVGEADYSNR